MANNYEQIMALVNAGNKMGLSNTITRDNGIPLDLSSVYSSYDEAVVYAATKAIAYHGQPVAVITDTDATLYIITPTSQGKHIVGSTEYDVYLKETGGKIEVDGKTIEIGKNGLQLVGLDKATDTSKTYVPSLVGGVLTWAEPDTSTAEGQATEIKALQNRATQIEATAVYGVELQDETHFLVLKNSKGEQIGEAIDTSVFVQDSFLDDVEYDAESGLIKFTWKMGDGSEKTDEIAVGDFVKTYTAGDGLVLTNGVFSVKPDTYAAKATVDTLSTDFEAHKTAYEAHETAFEAYKTSNDAAVADAKKAGTDAQTAVNGVKSDLGKSTIAHVSTGVAEGITATGATLAIVVDAYTQAQVDAKVKTLTDDATAIKGRLDTLETAKGDHETRIGSLETWKNTAQGSIDTLNTKVGTLETDITKKANSADVYTKTQTDTAIEEKIAAIVLPKEYDDTEVRGLITAETSRAQAAEKTNADAIATEKARVDTLVGTDTTKSARAIAEEVATAKVAEIVADAPENYDTLKEIADYIASDATGAAQMSNDIAALKTKVDTGEKNVSTYIADAIAAIPVATATVLGLVKASEEITVAADGTLGLGTVSTDKLVQGSNTLILNGNG